MIKVISSVLMLIGGAGYWISHNHPSVQYYFLIPAAIGLFGQFFGKGNKQPQ